MHLPITATLALTFLGSTLPSMADLAVYQSRVSVKGSGNGIEGAFSSQEFIIIDLESRDFSLITYGKIGTEKKYVIESGSPLTAFVEGSRNHTYSVFSSAGGEDGRYFMQFNKGRNSIVEVRTGADTTMPKVFKGYGNIINLNEPTRLTEYTRTATYSVKRTVAANDEELTIEDLTALIETELQEKDYTSLEATVQAAGDKFSPTATKRLLSLRFVDELMKTLPESRK
jgi:hypothetical protein